MRYFTISNFWIKLTNWEYWPWYIIYIPIFIFWLFLSLRARAIFFFSAANPAILFGGLIGSSKKQILDLIPKEYVPTTMFVKNDCGLPEVMQSINEAGLEFPLIFKPDIGERGWHVSLVRDKADLEKYLKHIHQDFIIQEYIDLPFEAGIFYYREPHNEIGKVSSVVVKEMLTVTGNGELTLRELIVRKPRARFQLKKFEQNMKNELDAVLDNGEIKLLEPIGNHSRGTAFLDGNYLINDGLIKLFDDLSKKIDGFYYGRFDLRCKDEEALYNGDFKIMELNGAASEPAHIYSPGYPIIKGYKSLFHHWNILYKISIANHKRGIKYMSFKTGISTLKLSRFIGQ